MRMRRALVASVVAGLAMLALPASAQETDATICSNLASVSWDVDPETVTVAGATIEVVGCDDGETVGLELITSDGDLPEDGPRGAEVTNGRAIFNLTDLEVGVEPVIGVRVYLVVNETEPPIRFLNLVIEQRFFNAPGNEQLGLRQTTTFTIAPGAIYVVPAAPSGYNDIDCADVSTTLPDDPVGEGAGQFPASGSGRHVACYRQAPGTTGGPGPGGPEVEPPTVLDAVAERGEVAGEQIESTRTDRASVRGRMLARSGIDATALLALSALLLALGGRLVVHRRRVGSD